MIWACEGLLDLMPHFGRQPVQIPEAGPAKTIAPKYMSSPSDPGPTAPQLAYLCKTHVRDIEIHCGPSVFPAPKPSPVSGCDGTALTAELRSPSDCYHSEKYLIGWLVRLYGWRVLEPGLLSRYRVPREAQPVPCPGPEACELEAAS
jgi:hypothetical protein